MTASEAAVRAAEEAMGCEQDEGDTCWHPEGPYDWTERGCAFAVRIADALAAVRTALDVECPTCDAAPGQDCRAPRTHSPSATHKGRWTVARAMT